jgi:hypothetical protein
MMEVASAQLCSTLHPIPHGTMYSHTQLYMPVLWMLVLTPGDFTPEPLIIPGEHTTLLIDGIHTPTQVEAARPSHTNGGLHAPQPNGVPTAQTNGVH